MEFTPGTGKKVKGPNERISGQVGACHQCVKLRDYLAAIAVEKADGGILQSKCSKKTMGQRSPKNISM